MNTILVTGATGRVGAEIVHQLSQPVRAGIRSPEKVRNPAPNVEYVRFDFSQPETFAAALQGVSRVFLMWPGVPVTEFIEAAEQAGVQHIVFLSIVVAGEFPFLPHRKVEKRLETSRMTYTFLRASYFMQNLETIHAADIRDHHEIFIPAGGGSVNFVDVRDVAAVAVKALTEPDKHTNKIYMLTGTDTLKFGAVARVFSEILQYEVRFTNPLIPRFIWRMVRGYGYPLSLIALMCIEYTASRFHMGTSYESAIPKLLHRPPITLRQYVQDFRRVWA